MSAREDTEQPGRVQLAVRTAVASQPLVRLAPLLLATLLALTLALAPRAEAFVYWAHTDGSTIGRANTDGSGVTQDFIRVGSRPCGVAVDATHVYWADVDRVRVGRANLDGTEVDPDWRSTVGFLGGM